MALRLSERLRRRDPGQPHNSGNDVGGLENVGKAKVTRSGSEKCSGSTLCEHWPFFDGGHEDLDLNYRKAANFAPKIPYPGFCSQKAFYH